MPSDLVSRLQATSYALSLQQSLRDIADEVYDLEIAGASTKQVNRRINDWMKERGLDYETWFAEMDEQLKDAPFFKVLDWNKVWLGYGVEPWLRECIRSVAYTDEPTPFLPFAAGYWMVDDLSDEPTLIAVMTPLTDPELAASQLKKKHKEVFGIRASGSPRKDEVKNARMLAMSREGMSYQDIAIQNLREKYPDIITRQHKYRDAIRTEKSRVAKAVSAAKKLWKERGLDSSTGE